MSCWKEASPTLPPSHPVLFPDRARLVAGRYTAAAIFRDPLGRPNGLFRRSLRCLSAPQITARHHVTPVRSVKRSRYSRSIASLSSATSCAAPEERVHRDAAARRHCAACAFSTPPRGLAAPDGDGGGADPAAADRLDMGPPGPHARSTRSPPSPIQTHIKIALVLQPGLASAPGALAPVAFTSALLMAPTPG